MRCVSYRKKSRESAASGTRTRTAITGQGILSPSCLPIPPLRHCYERWTKGASPMVERAEGWTQIRIPTRGKVVLYQLSCFRKSPLCVVRMYFGPCLSSPSQWLVAVAKVKLFVGTAKRLTDFKSHRWLVVSCLFEALSKARYS